MKNTCKTSLLAAALLLALPLAAAPADDAALQSLVAAYQEAAAKGDAKTVAAISHVPPAIAAKEGEAQARATLEKFLAAGLADGGRFTETFTISRIEYNDDDTRATIHGTAQTRDGDNINVRWRAVKNGEGHWTFEGMDAEK